MDSQEFYWLGDFQWLTIRNWGVLSFGRSWKGEYSTWVLSFILLLLHQLRNSFRYFFNRRLILQIPGACVLIAMSSAVTSIENIKNRGGDCFGEHHGWQCDWVTLLVINWDYFFWCQKELLIHLINFLFTPTDVSLKGSPSY